MRAARPSANSTATSTSARRSPWRSTARRSATVAGQGSVHRHLSGRPLCRHQPLRQALDRLLSVRSRRRQGRTRQGRPRRIPTATASSTSRPAPLAARTSRSRCWSTPTTAPTRALPKASSRRWNSLASASSLNSLTARSVTRRNQAGQFDWLVRRNDSELISVVQNTAAAGPDRSADQLAPPRRHGRHARPDAVRAGAGRRRQQVHRQPATTTSVPT